VKKTEGISANSTDKNNSVELCETHIKKGLEVRGKSIPNYKKMGWNA